MPSTVFTIKVDWDESLDKKQLTRRIVQAFEDPNYTPPRLPAVATELMAMSSQSDVDFSKLEALLERDATLAGEVLSLCQSVAYYRGERVRNLKDALLRIGLAKLGQIVMQAALSARVFRSIAYKTCMENLQSHSLATAHLAQIVSKHTGAVGDAAFLCGLMHDVGIAGILIVLGDTKRGQRPPDVIDSWKVIHNAHPAAGARMIELWELPPEIKISAAAHHKLESQGTPDPNAATVCIAEALAEELGHGFELPVPLDFDVNESANKRFDECRQLDKSDPRVIERAKQVLRLDETAYETIWAEATDWAKGQDAS